MSKDSFSRVIIITEFNAEFCCCVSNLCFANFGQLQKMEGTSGEGKKVGVKTRQKRQRKAFQNIS